MLVRSSIHLHTCKPASFFYRTMRQDNAVTYGPKASLVKKVNKEEDFRSKVKTDWR